MAQPLCLSRAVPQRNVSKLMRHDAGHLAFTLAARIIPEFTYIGPPGNAKALISRARRLGSSSENHCAEIAGNGAR